MIHTKGEGFLILVVDDVVVKEEVGDLLNFLIIMVVASHTRLTREPDGRARLLK